MKKTQKSRDTFLVIIVLWGLELRLGLSENPCKESVRDWICISGHNDSLFFDNCYSEAMVNARDGAVCADYAARHQFNAIAYSSKS